MGLLRGAILATVCSILFVSCFKQTANTQNKEVQTIKVQTTKPVAEAKKAKDVTQTEAIQETPVAIKNKRDQMEAPVSPEHSLVEKIAAAPQVKSNKKEKVAKVSPTKKAKKVKKVAEVPVVVQDQVSTNSSSVLKTTISTPKLKPAQAAATANPTDEEDSGFWQKLKRSPFSAQYLVEGSNGFKESINGYSFYNYLYLGYNINDRFAVKVVPYWKTDFTESQENKDGSRTIHQQYGATQARLYVKKLLTEKENGYSLYLQYRIYHYPAATRTAGYDAKQRFYLIGGKNITDKFRIGTYAFYESYIRNSGKSGHLGNYYAAVSPTYYISDKLYTSLTIDYYATKRKTGITESETLSVSPEIGYRFSWVSLSTSLSLEPVDFRGEDPDFVDETLKNARLVVSAYMSLF